MVAKLEHLKRFTLNDWDGEAALNLLSIALKRPGEGAEAALTNLSKSLENLQLRRCSLKSLPAIAVPFLTELNLEGCNLEKVDLKSIDLESCKGTLCKLNLTGCKLQATITLRSANP